MKTYTIIKTHHGRTSEVTNTLPELIKYFGYTLECGASYNGQKGCKKVNTEPKTIKSLVTALQNAVYNTQGSCYDPDSYDYDIPAEAETKKAATKKATKTQKTVQAILKAFTGMNIGTYTAEVTKSGYKIVTKNGKEMEFNKDGTQKVDCKNPRFNNRIEIVAEA